MKIKEVFTALHWLPTYKKAWLKNDISAGLTIGIMIIPQGMAYASIAGLPPVYGLYAAMVPLLFYVLLGTSRQLSVGPVALVSLLTAATLNSLGNLSIQEYISSALLLAFLVGSIQILLGFFRLGFLVNFLSHPVISGFTSAAAIIIGITQLKYLFGVVIPKTNKVYEMVQFLAQEIAHTNWISLAIGIAGILIIVFLKKINKSIPYLLVAVLFGIIVVTVFKLENQVEITREIANKLPKFNLHNFSFEKLETLFPMAVTIALVGYMQSIAIAKAIEAKHTNYQVEPNKELIALGFSNVLGSFFQSYPISGGVARTAVNNEAGAKTPLSLVFTIILLTCTLLFLTPFFYNLPKTILASIILVAVYGLIDIKEAKFLWKSDRTDFWLLIFTFLATLILGIEKGIALGVTLSIIMMVYLSTKPHIAILANVPNTHFYKNTKRFQKLKVFKEILIFRFDANIYFANSLYFKEKLNQIIATRKGELKLVIIDGESINTIDSSGVKMLKNVVINLQQQKIKVFLSHIKGPVRDTLKNAGLSAIIGYENCFISNHEAVLAYKEIKQNKRLESKYKAYTNQTNT